MDLSVMANRRQRRRVNTNRISFQRHTKLSNFVSFFVPFWFLSNLAGAVTDFGFGIVLYHSYIVALVLYLILFLQNGKERFVINREVFRFSLTHGAFMIVCLLSLLVISSDNEAISQFMNYAWMSLLSVGFVATYRHTQTMHYLFWGIFLALAIVCFVNLIEFVNIIGSLFYGTILGIFLVAFFFKQVGAKAVFIAAIITEAIVIFIFSQDWVAFLWLNLIGCVCVILIGLALQPLIPAQTKQAPTV